MSERRTSRAPDVGAQEVRIRRPRLAERIARSLDAGAVVLVAGAGFGKTTALDEALRLRDGRAAWISCTEAERDAGRLLGSIIAAVRRAAPGAADVLADRLAVAIEPVDVLAAAGELAAELGRLLVQPLVLVLDDA
ncbi:MAG: hypothetical protein M3N16_07880, partial [Actinomycetota bacterium]|nr:hypothetical protein [Actinomycetota bacterium]